MKMLSEYYLKFMWSFFFFCFISKFWVIFPYSNLILSDSQTLASGDAYKYIQSSIVYISKTQVSTERITET